jgi:NAD(P)-dependent dehydrogenase (short-subunit alcohol dehydrogenase family)
MLRGNVVVVVGGAGLLGKRFVQSIASVGGTVIVADRNLAAAEAVGRDVVSANRERVEPWPIDITDQDSIAALITGVADRHGRIDAVVNSAYPRTANYGRRLEEVEYSDFRDNLALHLGGYFLVAQQFAMFFRRQGYGNIVNIGSIYGTMTPRFEVYAGTAMTMPVEYAAIKAGVLQLTRYFAQYFKADGIRVNSLSPGGLLDGQAPLFVAAYAAHSGQKGMLAPEDVCGALLFLLGADSRYVTGQNLIVDDGFSL